MKLSLCTLRLKSDNVGLQVTKLVHRQYSIDVESMQLLQTIYQAILS